jgi:Co/Zn/Cd efflux system component
MVTLGREDVISRFIVGVCLIVLSAAMLLVTVITESKTQEPPSKRGDLIIYASAFGLILGFVLVALPHKISG